MMKPIIAGFVLCSTFLLVACAHAPPQESTAMPEPIEANSNETELLALTAKGDELYECQREQGASFAWIATGPEARLVDSRGDLVGVAFPGPGWQFADGSWAIGEPDGEAFQNAKTLPWTRFSVKRTSGIGMLGKVSSIQSIETRGGAVPDEACDANNAGAGRLVPYTAKLRFFVPASAADAGNHSS